VHFSNVAEAEKLLTELREYNIEISKSERNPDIFNLII